MYGEQKATRKEVGLDEVEFKYAVPSKPVRNRLATDEKET